VDVELGPRRRVDGAALGGVRCRQVGACVCGIKKQWWVLPRSDFEQKLAKVNVGSPRLPQLVEHQLRD
jgi:hypothetical protein